MLHSQLLKNIVYIPCVVQYMLEPNLHLIICTSHSPTLIFPAPYTGNRWFVLYIWVCFFFVTSMSLLYLLDSKLKWYHTVFVFLCLNYISNIMPFKSIHVAENGKFSFFFMTD